MAGEPYAGRVCCGTVLVNDLRLLVADCCPWAKAASGQEQPVIDRKDLH